MYKNRKPLIIGILCTLIVFMAIGFALLSQELTITGTSSIDSNWNIRITNIRVKNVVSAYGSGSNASGDTSSNSGCTPNNVSGCTGTTANFEAKLITPGDSITYEVTITNSGNLDGVVSSINLTCSENEAIECSTSGLNVADTISKNNGTNTVEVTVTYNNATTTQPANTTSSATLTINYQQDLGQVRAPGVYSVGDTINYKGSNWYVIKNSSSNENYITLIKASVLTGEEIGSNYVGGGNTLNNYMAYYWSSTCHYDLTYGNDVYSDDYDLSGCTNSYDSSKIKEVVDNYMTTNNITNDLAEVDGYKIRLIKLEELDNLGYGMTQICTGSCYEDYGWTSDTPVWVHQNFGTGVSGYWTMTPVADSNNRVWYVNSASRSITDVEYSGFRGAYAGVRPVINLLKTAIPAQS